ncbi:MAG: hypothetical protein O3C44_06305 [Proteobacteria bacterium]|nr:hypothetical protein [Pseudomonadota bacterium]MDA0845532.1 hypothetical protein [Pseudomonadota bacterium]
MTQPDPFIYAYDANLAACLILGVMWAKTAAVADYGKDKKLPVNDLGE